MGLKKRILEFFRLFKKNSIFIKHLRLVTILMLIPMIFISYISYKQTMSVTINEAASSNESDLIRARDLCDTLFGQADLITAGASMDNDVNLLMLGKVDVENNVVNSHISKINNFIDRYTLIYEYFDSIYVYTKRNEYIISNHGNYSVDNFYDNDWIDECEKSDSLIIKPRIMNDTYPYFLSFIKLIKYDDVSCEGAVAVNIDLKKIQQFLKNEEYPQVQNIYILGDDGTVYYSNDIELVMTKSENHGLLKYAALKEPGFSGKINADGKEYLVSVLSSGNGYDFKYISATPMSYYQDKFDSVIRNMFITILLMFIIVLMLSLFISASTYKPFKSIFDILKDNSDVKMSEEFDELEFIKNSIIRTISSNDRAEVELGERLEMLNNMNIIALQSQINPHFLYNTLESINWMAEELTNSSNEVTNSILDLSKLIHMYSESDFYLVTLRQEVEYVMLYVKILKSRYADMFEIELDIDEALFDTVVMKFCLQPIIENAVEHGIKPMGENGRVVISACKEDEKVVLSVRDNGVGISDTELEALKTRISEKYTLRGKHIGIHNVNQRIKLAFGDDYGVDVCHNYPSGLIVTITMPYTD